MGENRRLKQPRFPCFIGSLPSRLNLADRGGREFALRHSTNLATRFGNLARSSTRCDSDRGMTHYPQINALHRATRIQLATTQASITLGDGKRAKAKLQTISTTGGLLQVPKALAEGDFIEVTFETQSGNVQGMAEMLKPVRRGADMVSQPFRFIALDDDHHQKLHDLIESSNHRSFLGFSDYWATKF